MLPTLLEGDSRQLPVLLQDAGRWLSQLADQFKLLQVVSRSPQLPAVCRNGEKTEQLAGYPLFYSIHHSPAFTNGNQIKISSITAAMSLPNYGGLK